MKTIRAGGRLLKLDVPVIMGILNVTMDSFYGDSRLSGVTAIVERAHKMIEEGATILDIGGMSSRPGAKEIPVEEEIDRVVPGIQAIRSQFPDIFLSIDTYRRPVAAAAIDAGADLINDISAGELDPDLVEYAATRQIPVILMHMKGIPVSMQDNPDYPEGVVAHVLQYLLGRIKQYESLGLHDLIVDPGFGFGKTVDHNFQLLKRLEVFRLTGKPVLVGLSRKSMIYNVTGGTPDTALAGTIAAQMAALQKGASILRVHDVRAAADTIRIWESIG